jgi:hypothetical protein
MSKKVSVMIKKKIKKQKCLLYSRAREDERDRCKKKDAIRDMSSLPPTLTTT